MTDYSRFADPPYPPQPRHLRAPETFEGVVQTVTVRQARPRAVRDERYVLAFTLDPIDAGLAKASPALFIHDSTVHDAPSSPMSLAEHYEAIQRATAQREHAIERAKPVGIFYIFDPSQPGIWSHRAVQVGDIAREAFGDAFANEVVERLRSTWPEDSGMPPFAAPGQYVQSSGGVWTADEEPPVMRMLNELRGLRFIVDAQEMKTRNGQSYTHYRWARMRA